MSTVIEKEQPTTFEKDIHVELDNDLVQSLHRQEKLRQAHFKSSNDEYLVINIDSKPKREKRDKSYFIQLFTAALIMIIMGVFIAMSMAYDGLMLYELTLSSVLIVMLMAFRLTDLRRY